MLTLMLLRHAKAEAQGRGDDYRRRLTEKGEHDADRLGAYLTDNDLSPDVALVSAAARTARTFEIVGRHLTRPPRATVDQALFNATDIDLRRRLRAVDARDATCLIVGHNPGIMDAAIALASGGDHADLARLRGRFPPCALAILSFATDEWSVAEAGGGNLDALIFPEDLASEG